MKTLVDSNYIKMLFSKSLSFNLSSSTVKDSSFTLWSAATEISLLLSACLLFFVILPLIYGDALTDSWLVIFVVLLVLVVFTVFSAAMWIHFCIKLKKLAWDGKSHYMYELMDGVFIKRDYHGADSSGSGFTYDFKAREKTCIFSEIILLGDKHPTDEFHLVKIIFYYSNGKKAARIYGFNKTNFEMRLPNDKQRINLFEFNNLPFCSIVD